MTKTANHDVVYFVKNAPHNEELRYSLRSLAQNFPCGKVWIFGFCPYELNTDRIVNIEQDQPTKWENVRKLMRKACETDELTPDFWLFNDDFFIMEPTAELPPLYNGDIRDHIVTIENRHGGMTTLYTQRLRHLVKTLEKAGLGTKNYALHKPMLINRAKMLQTLDQFPDEPMMRALYGNHHNLGGENTKDCKLAAGLRPNIEDVPIISTDDYAFMHTSVGDWIRAKFPNRSKYEVD